MGFFGSLLLLSDGLSYVVNIKWERGATISVILLSIAIATNFGAISLKDYPLEYIYGMSFIFITSIIMLWLWPKLPGKKIDYISMLTKTKWALFFYGLSILGIFSTILGYPIWNLNDIWDTVSSIIGISTGSITWLCAWYADYKLTRICSENWRHPHITLSICAFVILIINIVYWILFK